MNLYLPWTTTQEKKSMSTNSSPGRTVRLNTALNTALIKKRIKSDTRNKCNTDTQQTQTNTITMEHNQADDGQTCAIRVMVPQYTMALLRMRAQLFINLEETRLVD